MKFFNETYQYHDIEPCEKHPAYEVIFKPHATCEQCFDIWRKRCIDELDYRAMAYKAAENKAISSDFFDKGFVLYWNRSGECVCISLSCHNFWFTINQVEQLHFGESFVFTT
ncbi:hypothetical protein PBI_SCTP2_398 [Salicola phage SCTP-2]|nr:hypothetical protein PBI_SCTP2_398 [Salicola phage SCTP-2]